MDRAEPIPPTAVGKAVYLVYAPFIKPVDDGFDHKRSLASRSGDPDPSGSGAGVACTVRIVTDAIRRQRRPGPPGAHAAALTARLLAVRLDRCAHD